MLTGDEARFSQEARRLQQCHNPTPHICLPRSQGFGRRTGSASRFTRGHPPETSGRTPPARAVDDAAPPRRDRRRRGRRRRRRLQRQQEVGAQNQEEGQKNKKVDMRRPHEEEVLQVLPQEEEGQGRAQGQERVPEGVRQVRETRRHVDGLRGLGDLQVQGHGLRRPRQRRQELEETQEDLPGKGQAEARGGGRVPRGVRRVPRRRRRRRRRRLGWRRRRRRRRLGDDHDDDAGRPRPGLLRRRHFLRRLRRGRERRAGRLLRPLLPGLRGPQRPGPARLLGRGGLRLLRGLPGRDRVRRDGEPRALGARRLRGRRRPVSERETK